MRALESLKEKTWIEQVEELIKSPFSADVNNKVQEFRSFRKRSSEEIFFELVFCIITANTSAKLGTKMQERLGIEPFLYYGMEELRNALHKERCRFYNTRSRYIYESRKLINELPVIINHPDPWYAREYLIQNVKGLGYKEASHFLRNTGTFSFAILDKHILRLVLGEKTNSFSLSKKQYIKIEKIFRSISESFGMEPGIFDLYVWKIASGQLIK